MNSRDIILISSSRTAESGSDGDYPSAESILSAAQGLRIGSEQLTFLLLLKMADEQP